jgi:TM2 domain-containing membrane protein YozV
MLVYCTKCGHRVSTTAVACPGCGAPPYRAGSPSNQVTQIVQPARPAVGTWEQPTRAQVVVIASQKSAGLAAVLSALLPGLGQIYNGNILKGFVFLVIYAPCVWFGFAFTFLGGMAAMAKPDDPTAANMVLFGFVALVAAPTMWLYSIVNAYRTAERLNRLQLATY